MQFLTLVVSFADEVPKDEDVKAGWLAFAIFIGLILAVAFLGFSLVKQLRKAQAAEDAGLYDPSDKKKPVELPVDQPSEQPPTPGA
ncbi:MULTISPECIES: hypothetical protein [unclassified Nocardioides]|uniref:hypothetical protein n=1 Tax=Nocardioides sp. URHA0032 TaxID=1380388 RepID=UPI00048E4D79|nr:hypothetical protein [Nocardioides sp. URHA0032]